MEEKDMAQVSQEDFQAFKAWKEEKERKERRQQELSAYEELVDKAIEERMGVFARLSGELAKIKADTFETFASLIAMKREMCKVKAGGQRSHTFTSKDGKSRITLGVTVSDNFTDLAETGIEKVKEYIQSLSKDEDSKALVSMVLDLLSKDQKGNLNANKVIQLRKVAKETENKDFIEAVALIERAYSPMVSKTYIRAEVRGENGKWTPIPLSVIEAKEELPSGKRAEDILIIPGEKMNVEPKNERENESE